MAAAVFASGMTPSVLFIRAEHVDYEAAREGGGNKDSSDKKDRSGWRELVKDRKILLFTSCVLLYYFANAATLPLISEILTQAKKARSAAWQVAAAVIVAEVAMVGVAVLCGSWPIIGGGNHYFSSALAHWLCETFLRLSVTTSST